MNKLMKTSTLAALVLAAGTLTAVAVVVPGLNPVPEPSYTVAATGALVDHSAYDKLLKKYVTAQGLVDYKGFKADEVTFNQYLALLSKNPPAANWSKADQMSYWINAYNAYTIRLILDLSYRAQLRGWRFRYLPHVVAPAELPAHLAALRSQQHRWNKGAAETARKHLGQVWRTPALSLATKVHATFHLLNSSVFAVILLMALLSVPLVAVRAHQPGFKLAFQLASVFVFTLLPLTTYYYTAWRRAGPRTDQWFAPTFLLFLAMSMGLALHNARAVVQGWLRRASPFVRTPKLGTGGLANRVANPTGTPPLPLAEGALTLYFLAGLATGFYYHTYGLLPFHVLLIAGFGTLTGYALRQRLARVSGS